MHTLSSLSLPNRILEESHHMECKHYAIAAVAALSVATLVLSGLVLGQYLVARLIVGTFWTASALAWASCYVHSRRLAGLHRLQPVRVPAHKQ